MHTRPLTARLQAILVVFLAFSVSSTFGCAAADGPEETTRGPQRVGTDTGVPDRGRPTRPDVPDDVGTIDAIDDDILEDDASTAPPDDAGTPGEDDATPPPDTGPTPDTGPIGPPPPVCETLSVSLKPEEGSVASFLLVVDRSNSMTEGDRWTAMVASLREVTSSLDSLVNFGLMLFPGPGADAFLPDPCATGDIRVRPGERTATSISTALSGRPAGGTPTAPSLLAARDALLAANPSGRNYILLATDGGPGCNRSLSASTCECIPGFPCRTNNVNCLDRERTLQAVRDVYAAGIQTFVMGIPGTAEVADLLDEMAAAGGTDTGSGHIAVADTAGVLAALRTAAGSTVPCTWEFPEAPSNPADIVLTINGTPVARDPSRTNGWDIERGRYLEFYGAACARLRDGTVFSIEASYDCAE